MLGKKLIYRKIVTSFLVLFTIIFVCYYSFINFSRAMVVPLNKENKRKRKITAISTSRCDCESDSKQDMKKTVKFLPQFNQLPEDILITVFSRLYLVDQIRSSVVCKRWKQLLEDIRAADTLPWMMLGRWNKSYGGRIRSICKLFVPSHKKAYTIEDGYNGERKSFVDAKTCCSKYGWVLLSEKRDIEKVDDDTSSTFFFAYSPFKNEETVKLPELKMGFSVASFSSAPTSKDCVFFTLLSSSNAYIYKTITISICCLGDQAWKTFDVVATHENVQNVTYLDGTFYCLFGKGSLGAFDVATEKWQMLKLYHRSIFHEPYLGITHLVESDGQLLRVCLEKGKKWQLSGFDLTQKDWVEEETLGNRAIFISRSSTISIQAVGEASEFADTVIEGGQRPYSFKTGQRLCHEGPYAHVLKEGLRATWIQPFTS